MNPKIADIISLVIPKTQNNIEPNMNNTKRFMHNLLPFEILHVNIQVIITEIPLK